MLTAFLSKHFVAALLVLLLASCASVEKNVVLPTGQEGAGNGSLGEAWLAAPVFARPLARLPGGRFVLGEARGTGTQLVTYDDPSIWIRNAMAQRLREAGYTVRTTRLLPASAGRGIIIRVSDLSVSQDSGVVTLNTSAKIALAVEIWKNGRLRKTLTASAGSQDEVLGRSGEAVAASLKKNLRIVMEELMPGIANALEE